MEKIYIFRENGTIRQGNSSEIPDFKENWTFIQEDPTKTYVLVDNDATRVAPIAKAILDQFELFPELTWIKRVFFTILLVFGVLFVIDIYQLISSPSKDFLTDNFKKIGEKEQRQVQIQRPEVLMPELPRQSGIPSAEK